MTNKKKAKNSGFTWIVLLILVAALLGTTFTSMQSVGDRRILLACDSLGEAESSEPPEGSWTSIAGTLEIVSDRKTQGSGSVHVTLDTGTHTAMAYCPWYGSGDTYGIDLSAEQTLSYDIYIGSYSGSANSYLRMTCFEWNGNDWIWTDWEWTAETSRTTLAEGQWNTVEVDLSTPDRGGHDWVSAPGLQHVDSIMFCFSGYESIDLYEYWVDNVEAIYTGYVEPPSNLVASITPSPLTVTEGSTATFTASVSGTGTTEPYSYQWYIEDDLQSETGDSLTITNTVQGTYDIKVEVTDDSVPQLSDDDSTILYVTGAGNGNGQTYTLTVNVDPSEGGKVINVADDTEVSGSVDLAENSQIQLEAQGNTNYQFKSWTIDDSDIINNPTTITMNEDHSVTANFEFSAGSNGNVTNGKWDLNGTDLEDLLDIESIPMEYMIFGSIAIVGVAIIIWRKKIGDSQ